MATPGDLLFGQIALRRGFLTEDQLDMAIGAQERARHAGRPAPLGQICLQKGFFNQIAIDTILREQGYTETRCADRRLGELAVLNQMANATQVAECLAAQRAEYEAGRPVPRLGEILVQHGYLSEQHLRALLGAQTRLVARQTGAAVAPPPPPPPAGVPAGAPARTRGDWVSATLAAVSAFGAAAAAYAALVRQLGSTLPAFPPTLVFPLGAVAAGMGALGWVRSRRAQPAAPGRSAFGISTCVAALALLLLLGPPLLPAPGPAPTQPAAPAPPAALDRNQVFAGIQRRTDPAVCLIFVEYRVVASGRIFHQASSTGTGFLFHPDGYVVTNKHVAFPWIVDGKAQTLLQSDPSTSVECARFLWFAGSPLRTVAGDLDLAASFSDRGKPTLSIYAYPRHAWRTQKVKVKEDGLDKERLARVGDLAGTRDLAVLKVEWGSGPRRAPVRLAAAGRLPRKLDPVMVLGFPLGLSPIQGRVAETSAALGEVRKVEDTIQITAPTSHGNSGGPLFTADGEVVGITTRLGGEEQADLLVDCIRTGPVRDLVPELFVAGDGAAARCERAQDCMQRGRMRQAARELADAAGGGAEADLAERQAQVRAAQSKNDAEGYLFLAWIGANLAAGSSDARVLLGTSAFVSRYLDARELDPDLEASWRELKPLCGRLAGVSAGERPAEVARFRSGLAELGTRLAGRHGWPAEWVADRAALDLLESARDKVQQSRVREALAELEQLGDRLPPSFLRDYVAGMARLRSGDLVEGRKELERAASSFPACLSPELPAYQNLCGALAGHALSDRRWEDAERWATRVLEVYPTESDSLRMRSLARLRLARPEPGMADARTWLETRPDDPEPYVMAARVYAAGFRDPDHAVHMLELARQKGLKDLTKVHEIEDFEGLKSDPRFDKVLGK